MKTQGRKEGGAPSAAIGSRSPSCTKSSSSSPFCMSFSASELQCDFQHLSISCVETVYFMNTSLVAYFPHFPRAVSDVGTSTAVICPCHTRQCFHGHVRYTRRIRHILPRSLRQPAETKAAEFSFRPRRFFSLCAQGAVGRAPHLESVFCRWHVRRGRSRRRVACCLVVLDFVPCCFARSSTLGRSHRLGHDYHRPSLL